MKNKPAYAIDSVDHALRLVQLLEQEGELGVSAAAAKLQVARSTAHRLLAMLVYRDFAEQGADRRYRTGPALRNLAEVSRPAAMLRQVALPRLHVLVARVNETVNLQVRVGDQVRFVESVQCEQVLRVGDRAGRVLPAHLVSGGKVLLAALANDQVRSLYAGREDIDVPGLLRELSLIRRRGFAINNQKTERGVTAVGVLVRGVDAEPVAAISVAIPTARFIRDDLPVYVSALTATAVGIQGDLVHVVEL